MTRLSANIKIQEAMGWTRRELSREKPLPVGCEDGYCWVDPEGACYEGNDLMVRDHIGTLEAAAKVLPAFLSVVRHLVNETEEKTTKEGQG